MRHNKHTKHWVIIACLVLLITVFFTKYEVWNLNSRIDLTRAIVEEKSLSIDGYHYNTGDRLFVDGKYYSDKQPGASFMLILIYATYSIIVGPIERPDATCDTRERKFCYEDTPRHYAFIIVANVFLSTIPIALATIIIYLIAYRRKSKKEFAMLCSLLFMFGTSVFGLMTQVGNHQWGMALVLMLYYMLFESQYKYKNHIAYICILCTPIIDIISAVGCICVVIYYIYKKRNWNSIFLITMFACGISFLLIYNMSITGDTNIINNKHLDREVFSQKYIGKGKILPLGHYARNELNYFHMYNIIAESPKLQRNPLNKWKLSFVYNQQGDTTIMTSPRGIIHTYKNNSNSIRLVDGTSWSYDIMQNTSGIYYMYNGTLIHRITRERNVVNIFDATKDEWIITNCTQIFFPEEYVAKKYICLMISTNSIGESQYIFYHVNYTKENEQLDERKDKNYTIVYDIVKIRDNGLKVRFINLMQLLFFPGNGFFFFNPLLLMGFVYACIRIFKKPIYAIGISILALNTMGILLNTVIWWGGATYGPKYFAVSIPFLFIPLIDLLSTTNIKKTRKPFGVLCAVLLILGFIINIPSLFFFMPNFVKVTTDGELISDPGLSSWNDALALERFTPYVVYRQIYRENRTASILLGQQHKTLHLALAVSLCIGICGYILFLVKRKNCSKNKKKKRKWL